MAWHYRTMQRLWIFRPASPLVVLVKVVLQVTEAEDVEVILFGFEDDENADKIGVQEFGPTPDRLLSINDVDVQEGVGAELPRAAVDGFDLNGNGVAPKVGRHQIKHGNVAGKGTCNIAEPPQLRCHRCSPIWRVNWMFLPLRMTFALYSPVIHGP